MCSLCCQHVKAFNKIFILSVLTFLLVTPVTAQDQDSLKIYKKIKKVAVKNRFLKMAYDAVFIDPEPGEYCENTTNCEEVNVNPFLKHKDKLIRTIRVVVYDPFGYSVTDTIQRKINYFQKAGNLSHIRTRKWIIINRLLFHEYELLDPLRITESERLLREAVFVNDAKITVEELLTTKDTVDIRVIVHDKWAIQIPVLITDVSSNVKLQNRNLLGLGQQFEQYVGFTRPHTFDYRGYYAVDNLDNTYISSRLAYQASVTNTLVGLSFDRGFYSPLVLWAGGVSANHNHHHYHYLSRQDSTVKRMGVNSVGFDTWLGRAIKLNTSSNKIFNQSTNILVGSRFYHTDYIKRPPVDIDSARSIYNTSAYIGNVGFAVQQYYKDRFIHRFGANEDVPEGLIVQYIYGGIKKQYDKIRYYSGFEIARARHFDFGYLSATFSYGVFFNKAVPNDITSNFNIYYFSDLKRIKKWFFRQFVYYNFVHGANKLFNETITLSGSELYGFSPGSLTGNTKMVLNSETVAYAPYNVIGFRFAPVLMVGLGMLGSPETSIVKSHLYQGYSAGIMLRNENLVSSTFQISVGFYPFLPDGKKNVLMYNPVTSFTLRVRGFAVSRPEFVGY